MRSSGDGYSRTWAAPGPDRGWPRPTRTGASKGPPDSHLNGPPWTPQPTTHGPGISSRGDSKRATPSTQQPSPYSSGSGAPCPSSKRPGEPWQCWPSGFRQPPANSSSRPGTNPLITLGSAPLHIPSFRETVLAQLGERRLSTAIDVDLAGETARSKPLDADTKGSLRDIHKRVGTAMLFESSGGMIDRVAHLPELRFALGEPDVETTTIDNAAAALAETGFFIRRAGADGYRIHHQATLRKAVADLRASLDEETEVKPAIRKLVEQEFSKGARIQKVYFPEDSTAVSDDPRMTLVVMNPDEEWREDNHIPSRISQWTRERGRSPRLYPAALVWCIRKPGRDLRDKVELWLAWQKVKSEIDAGTMGPEFERRDLEELGRHTRNAEEEAVEEVSASYRHVALQDSQTENGLKTIDLGAGYAGGKRHLDRAGGCRTQGQRPAERVRRSELHREALAPGPQGQRDMAPQQPPAELPQRIPDKAAGSRPGAPAEDR